MSVSKIVLSFLLLSVVGCGSGKSNKPYVNTDGYPLDICVVTEQKLGSMGDPFVIKYQDRTVKFCCAACLKDFNKEPAKYMAMIEEAEKKKTSASK